MDAINECSGHPEKGYLDHTRLEYTREAKWNEKASLQAKGNSKDKFQKQVQPDPLPTCLSLEGLETLSMWLVPLRPNDSLDQDNLQALCGKGRPLLDKGYFIFNSQILLAIIYLLICYKAKVKQRTVWWPLPLVH